MTLDLGKLFQELATMKWSEDEGAADTPGRGVDLNGCLYFHPRFVAQLAVEIVVAWAEYIMADKGWNAFGPDCYEQVLTELRIDPLHYRRVKGRLEGEGKP